MDFVVFEYFVLEYTMALTSVHFCTLNVFPHCNYMALTCVGIYDGPHCNYMALTSEVYTYLYVVLVILIFKYFIVHVDF